MSQKLHRALLTEDAGGTIRVLATDSGCIGNEFEHCSTDAEELGLVKPGAVGAGLWLWEGTATARDQRCYEDLYPEWVMDFEGEVTRIELFDERLPLLLEMCPPQDAD